MSSTAASPAPRPKPAGPAQPIAVKIFHWLNLVSLTLMLTSGLQIYNANPVFGGRAGWHFPDLFILGGWLAGGRHWHFAAMWLFALNLLWYGIYLLMTRRWQNRYFGTNDFKALQTGKNPKRKNYAWHRLTFTLVIPVLLLALLSGLGMYKPVQFHWIVDLFGSWEALRIVHFMTVPVVVVFAFVHSLLGLKVGGGRLTQSIFW
ncbi:MAG: cytochrome b/b6 domain-containing protein [Gemmatimonadaceae bacterium]|nr:cytochrome b/b6 domain-containing protein [Gloeobacterales cyanobacterium ES-bin-141]